jgi:hypothetical protein
MSEGTIMRNHTSTWLILAALTCGGVGGIGGCDLQEGNDDVVHDNAKGRTQGDGANTMTGSEATGRSDPSKTMGGGNTAPTQDR